MKSDSYNNDRRVSQWTVDELDKLHELARKKARKDTLLAMFPGRTYAAIKVRLWMVRKELGIAKEIPQSFRQAHTVHYTMLDRDDPGTPCDYPRQWAQRAATSNARFLAALGVSA